MISFYTIVTFLLCHWIFDFHLQTDEMAKNKSTNNGYLFEHVWIYGGGVLLMSILNINYFPHGFIAFTFVAINVIFHFLTDWVTSRATSALYKEERYHDFFCVIGADQMVHYITLFGTFVWLTNL